MQHRQAVAESAGTLPGLTKQLLSSGSGVRSGQASGGWGKRGRGGEEGGTDVEKTKRRQATVDGSMESKKRGVEEVQTRATSKSKRSR